MLHPCMMTKGGLAFWATLSKRAQKRILDKERRGTCYHEAGHALASRALGFGIRYIWVPKRPRRARFGWTGGQVSHYRELRGPSANLITVLYAGQLAENRLKGERCPVRFSDADEIDALLKRLPKHTRAGVRRIAYRRAHAILHDGWRGVERLAEHLFRHQRIATSREIDRVIGH